MASGDDLETERTGGAGDVGLEPLCDGGYVQSGGVGHDADTVPLPPEARHLGR